MHSAAPTQPELTASIVEPTTALPEEQSLISAAAFTWATRLLLAYFGLRLIFFALTVSSFIPPDEVTHAGLCNIFSQVFLLPENSPETYEFGLVTNMPWLYYWVMGKLLHLNFFGVPDLIFLRLLNIPLAFGTVFVTRRTLLLFTEDRLTHLLLLVAITNTAMFSFLSASVSYDNLTTFLAALAIYYQLAFFKSGSGNLLGASWLAQLAGCLCKITFLPLVLALNVLLLLRVSKDLPALPGRLLGYLKNSSLRSRALMVVGLVALALNVQLHAGNYLHFGTLSPAMEQVTSAQAAVQNRIGARENIFRSYTEGRISYMEALQKAGEIRHPGDKADTFFMLMNYENLKANPSLWLGPVSYARVWAETMAATIFGIKGHKGMYKEGAYLIPIFVVLALSAVAFAVRWRWRDSGWLSLSAAAVATFYAGFLLWKINYSSYLYYGTPGPTLQGRYLFPVLGSAYVVACYYLLRLFSANSLRLALAVATAVLFIAYDFPWFLSHATAQWISWPPQ